ncbi:hypothetical protein GCM10010912_01800 [Paenibacillus albidus]|uniref:N-acetyltransferase domain-containing protein n=1 Tax=Paenibacillus albidus TaxID=2041023 RepID=A0A917BXP0_9BACL|nr:GNAT family N-acetyltransferase [Paenibacillus albidus]GGF60175.1 hypothetical protein GCM10010912_01800 [Paenibacillus albidus]
MDNHGKLPVTIQRGQTVDLRPLLPVDAPALRRLLIHPEIRPHVLLRGEPGAQSVYLNKLLKRLLSVSAPNELHLGVCHKGEQRLIGIVSLQNWKRREGRAMLGYMLDPAWWGRGFATEAVGLLLGYCVRELGLTRIEGRCRGNNSRSERVMLKNGMTLERLLPVAGTAEDVMKVFTLLHK